MHEDSERQASLAEENFSTSTANRHFSNLNLPRNIECYTPAKKKCPATIGLDNPHTELLALLISDNIFRDFFNVYLLLPIHSHQFIIKQSNEDCYFEAFPLVRGSGSRLSSDRMLQWLYSNRLPFFLMSRIYQLSLFAHAFCEDNMFIDYDENIEYTKKELMMFSDLRTVEGIQKLIRHAGNSSDGTLIQLWLDLQLLRQTDREHGRNDMLKNISERYSESDNKLPQHFKQLLQFAFEKIALISLNVCQLKRRQSLSNSYDILVHNPFIQKKDKESSEQETDPLFQLQVDIMKSLKKDFCRRFLSYYDVLPDKFNYAASPDTLIPMSESAATSKMDDDLSVDQEIDPLKSGRSKSALPQIRERASTDGVQVPKRPKTSFPHKLPNKASNLSRISAKTSGYISMSPDDKLAVCSSTTSSKSNLVRSLSTPNILEEDQNKKTTTTESTSLVYITDEQEIKVNKPAIEKCKILIATQANNRKDQTLELEAETTTSDLGESPLPEAVKSDRVSPSRRVAIQQDESNRVARIALGNKKHSDTGYLIPERKENKLEQLVILPTLKMKRGSQIVDPRHATESVILDSEISMSIRRKTKFQDVMHSRRASSFLRKPPVVKQYYNNNTGANKVATTSESKKLAADILKNKTPETMLVQDKARFYVAVISCDQLAGGPFRNYLLCLHNEKLLETLDMWENIETIRCLTNEGGRRGAAAKSFGGNGFLSCHDEFTVQKDDPYHQYHESLRQIKKYPDSWADFNKKLQYIEEFFGKNPIGRPLDAVMLQKYVDQLSAAGCNDEILALVQDHCITRMRKQVGKYYKFDSDNFSYYLSQHDKQIKVSYTAIWNKTDVFMKNCRRQSRSYHTSEDLVRETIFSPLSGRLWVAIDMCERMIFPFAVRKLSVPMLTLGSMLQMKMFLVRKRREKEAREMKAQIELLRNQPAEGKNLIMKPKKKYLKAKTKKKPIVKDPEPLHEHIFFLNWDAIIQEHKQKIQDVAENLKKSITKQFSTLAPPSIDDMFFQDPTAKTFRRFIIRNFRGAKKEHMINVVNFFIASREVEDKRESSQFGEISKSLCSSFIFGKQSILHDIDLPEGMLKLISKKRSSNPTFLIFITSLVKLWIYENWWSSYISKMYNESLIDHDQFFKEKELRSWKTSVLNKSLSKRLIQFSVKISNFLSYLSVPEQFDEFRTFLANQTAVAGNVTVDKVYFGRKNKKTLIISANKLVQDLFLLIEIFAFKNLFLTSKHVAEDLTLNGREEHAVFNKGKMIIDIFFDSSIQPRHQINLPTPVSADIVMSLTTHHVSYSMFNEATAILLQVLLIYWKKFWIEKMAPESAKKAKLMSRLSGTAIPLNPNQISNKISCNPGITVTSSLMSKISSGKAAQVEIGGFNFTASKGCKELYRAKFMAIPSSLSASKTIKSIHSSVGNQLSRPSINKLFGPRISSINNSRKRSMSLMQDPKRKSGGPVGKLTMNMPSLKESGALPRKMSAMV